MPWPMMTNSNPEKFTLSWWKAKRPDECSKALAAAVPQARQWLGQARELDPWALIDVAVTKAHENGDLFRTAVQIRDYVRSRLLGIALNARRMYLRRQHRERAAGELSEHLGESIAQPLDELIRREELGALAREILRLPRQQQAALSARLAGLSDRDGAARLSVAESSYRTHLQRAKQRLRKQLGA